MGFRLSMIFFSDERREELDVGVSLDDEELSEARRDSAVLTALSAW